MNHLLANEMAKRVRVQRVVRKYDNTIHFMHHIEEAFIQSNARPISVVVSEIDERLRLRVNTLDENGREADLGEIQEFFTTLGYPSNCFRCRADQGLPNEAYIRLELPHPFNVR